jgi:transcriptional regulator GlxA family with amidase domain
LAGFGSAVSLRQHFKKALGVNPSVWRQSFTGTSLPFTRLKAGR